MQNKETKKDVQSYINSFTIPSWQVQQLVIVTNFNMYLQAWPQRAKKSCGSSYSGQEGHVVHNEKQASGVQQRGILKLVKPQILYLVIIKLIVFQKSEYFELYCEKYLGR